MEQTVKVKYEGPQWIDDFGYIRNERVFNSYNIDLAKQILGHRWPSGKVFNESDETIMDLQREGSRQFREGDAVCGSYEVTKQVQHRMSTDKDGVGYTEVLVPRIVKIIEQKPSSTADGSTYMWAKCVVKVNPGGADPELKDAERRAKATNFREVAA
jgi:hypothetical protein